MASSLALNGLYVPLITPFSEAGDIDADALERLCRDLLAAGAAGLVALGTTGEPGALTDAERSLVIDTCATACAAADATLIVGAGGNITADSVAAVKELAGIPGLAAALVVVPYYLRPKEDGIVEHFKAVAAASPVPLIIYNIPYRTGRCLGPAGVLELAALDGIAGVKQAVGSLDADTLEILAGAPDGFSVLAGDDMYVLPTVLAGGGGAIAAAAHTCTGAFAEMIALGLAGDVAKARALSNRLLPVVKAMFVETNPCVAKGVLHAQGRIASPALRLPMTAASAGAVADAMAAVAAAGG